MGIEIGQTISHYKILRKLGHGGMGDVYLAENTRLGLKVALKFVASELTRDPKAIKRLEHEARAVAELSHNNISRINDIKVADGHRFLVLEYLEGETLSDRIQRGPISIEETIRIGKALAEGLAHAHARGIVHRDVKAQNVMLTPDAGVKLMDFGLARMADATRLTEPGTTLGTVSHMSPEQASGKEADGRSDLWSLGVVLYQCLTGRLPFAGESAPVVLDLIRTTPPSPPTSLRTGVPMDLDRTILRCLEKDPGLRYQHADDLLAELRRLQSSTSSSTSDATTVAITRPSDERPGRKRQWAVLVLAVAVAATAVLWRSVQNREPDVFDSPEDIGEPERPNWILMADFDAPPDEPVLGVVGRELVTAALGQSKLVTPLSRSQLRRGLELAGKPDSVRIAGDVARELAFRAGARTYVEGRVDRVLSGFSVSVRVLDANDGRIVASASRTANNEEVFMSALDTIGAELRQLLGEDPEGVRSARFAVAAFTPSFDAYKKYVLGREFLYLGSNSNCIRLMKEAVRLDPKFASAWISMGVSYNNLGMLDSAQTAWQHAKDNPSRLTDTQRLRIESRDALSAREKLALVEIALKQFPFSAAWHNERGNLLWQLGRPEDAYRSYVRANQVLPFGESGIIMGNIFEVLVEMGRLEEAMQIVAKQRGPGSMIVALARGDWEEASELAPGYAENPSPIRKPIGTATLASLRASRGELGAAIQQMHLFAQKAPSRWAEDYAKVVVAHFAAIGRQRPPANNLEALPDTTVSKLLVRGIQAVSSGNFELARRCLIGIEQIPLHRDHDRYQVDIRVLAAWIAAGSSDYDEVIRLLEPVAGRGPASFLTGKLPARWLLAESFERRRDWDSAERHYRLVLDSRGLSHGKVGQENAVHPFYSCFAHHRLALLYSKMGRVEDARRHWEAFSRMFTNPDPALAPMVEEARQALQEAEAKAAS